MVHQKSRRGTEHPDNEDPTPKPPEAPSAEGNARKRPQGETPEEELEAVRAEREEYLQRWQRAQADYRNLRRRELALSEERARRALQPMLEKLLTVLDHLDMALGAPATSEESRNLATGVRLTRDQFLGVLEQEGVRPIPTGGKFDPAIHEAKGTLLRPDLEAGAVVETIRTGYTWHEDVLRHAHVIVAQQSEPNEAEPAVEEEA